MNIHTLCSLSTRFSFFFRASFKFSPDPLRTFFTLYVPIGAQKFFQGIFGMKLFLLHLLILLDYSILQLSDVKTSKSALKCNTKDLYQKNLVANAKKCTEATQNEGECNFE